MNTLVVIKNVPDASCLIHIQHGKIIKNDLTYGIDGLDEHALEAALTLREAGMTGELLVLAIGDQQEQALRSALALGADRALLVQTEITETLTLAQIIAQIATQEHVSLILMGGTQSDEDTQAMGPACAAYLDWPQVTWVTELKQTQGMFYGRHDTDEGHEAYEVNSPVVITMQQNSYSLRYPSVQQIIESRKKELCLYSIEDDKRPVVQIISYRTHKRERLSKRITGNPKEVAIQLADLIKKKSL